MVAEANAKIENLFQGIDALDREELVTYVNFVLSKVREMALGKAQEAAVKWTEEYFSTSPILPLLRTLSMEGRVDVKVIDYQTTLEAGLAGDLVATVEKLVMETLNRLLIRGGQNPNVDRPQKERKPDEGVIGLDGREGNPAEKVVASDDDDATTISSPGLSKNGRKLGFPVLEAIDGEQVRIFFSSIMII